MYYLCLLLLQKMSLSVIMSYLLKFRVKFLSLRICFYLPSSNIKHFTVDVFFMKLKKFSEYCLHFLKQRILRPDACIVDVDIRLARNENILLCISFLLTYYSLVSQILTLKNIVEMKFFSVKICIHWKSGKLFQNAEIRIIQPLPVCNHVSHGLHASVKIQEANDFEIKSEWYFSLLQFVKTILCTFI